MRGEEKGRERRVGGNKKTGGVEMCVGWRRESSDPSAEVSVF